MSWTVFFLFWGGMLALSLLGLFSYWIQSKITLGRREMVAMMNISYIVYDAFDTVLDISAYTHMFAVLAEIKGASNCDTMHEKSYFSSVVTQQSVGFFNYTTFHPYPPVEWYETFDRYLELVTEPGLSQDGLHYSYLGRPDLAEVNIAEYEAGCLAFGEECLYSTLEGTHTCEENDAYNNRFAVFETLLTISLLVWLVKEACKFLIVLYTFCFRRIPKYCQGIIPTSGE